MIDWIYDLSLMPKDQDILISYITPEDKLIVVAAVHKYEDNWGDSIYSEWDVPKEDIIAFAFINYPIITLNNNKNN